MVICLEQGADLHTAQLMTLPLTVTCFSKIQTGFAFLVLAYLAGPEKGPLHGCVYYYRTDLCLVCVYRHGRPTVAVSFCEW